MRDALWQRCVNHDRQRIQQKFRADPPQRWHHADLGRRHRLGHVHSPDVAAEELPVGRTGTHGREEDDQIQLTELIANASWREAATYRDTSPHEYVLLQKDNQRELLEAVCERLRNGEGVTCRFFTMSNQYLFIGSYKYWLMVPPDQVDWDNEEVLNRARLYRDRRDFVIQEGTVA